LCSVVSRGAGRECTGRLVRVRVERCCWETAALRKPCAHVTWFCGCEHAGSACETRTRGADAPAAASQLIWVRGWRCMSAPTICVSLTEMQCGTVVEPSRAALVCKSRHAWCARCAMDMCRRAGCDTKLVLVPSWRQRWATPARCVYAYCSFVSGAHDDGECGCGWRSTKPARSWQRLLLCAAVRP